MGQLDNALLNTAPRAVPRSVGRAVGLAVRAACLVMAHAAQAQMPSGGQVVAGSVTLPPSANSPAAQQTITQHSHKAIVNWDSFSIGAGNHLRINQPSRQSVLLNRVTGNNPSAIFGQLTANGQIFLVNPQGIYFAPGAQLDVGGLVASTLAIRDDDFLAGRYRFSQVGAGNTAISVINDGVIRAREGGYVVLAGDYAANRGIVQAQLGSVVLAAGSAMTLDVVGDSLVNFAVNERSVHQLAGVANSGELLADGGRVIMTAATARALTTAAVNNSGLIQARGTDERDGAVFLLADAGNIALDNGSLIDVSGTSRGGGTVHVGGDFHGATSGGISANAARVNVAENAVIRADAGDTGNGGRVVVWSDERTYFAGIISARGGRTGGNGGFVETSGRERLIVRGTVDTSAEFGRTGTWLLDPTNIEVKTGGEVGVTLANVANFADLDVNNAAGGTDATTNTIDTALINAALSNVVLQATNNITFTNAVTIAAANIGLSAQAGNSIFVNAAINTNNGAISLSANDPGGTAVASGSITGNGALNAGTAAITVTTNGGTGNINLGGALTAGAPSSFATSGALTLGTLALASNLNATSVGAMNLGGGSIGGNLVANSNGGAITQAGALTVTGTSALNAGASTITLNHANHFIDTLSLSNTGHTRTRWRPHPEQHRRARPGRWQHRRQPQRQLPRRRHHANQRARHHWHKRAHRRRSAYHTRQRGQHLRQLCARHHQRRQRRQLARSWRFSHRQL
jgi:filamentous hemagglutinin family protein